MGNYKKQKQKKHGNYIRMGNSRMLLDPLRVLLRIRLMILVTSDCTSPEHREQMLPLVFDSTSDPVRVFSCLRKNVSRDLLKILACTT